MACSALLIPMSITHKTLKLRYYKYKAKMRSEEGLVSSGFIYEVVQDVLISLIMPYKYFSGTRV